MATPRLGRYWTHIDHTGQVDRQYYFGPEGAQFPDEANGTWCDLPDDLDIGEIEGLHRPSPVPHAGRPPAPIAQRGSENQALAASALWTQAMAAVKEAYLYPMLTPEYRAAIQQAYQLFQELTVRDDGLSEVRRTDAEANAHKLSVYLSIDWSDVDLVEVRYKDGRTAVLHLATDPASRECLRDAVAIRLPGPTD